ncbi:hypothetical protein ACFW16_04545 [Inquilinus sp. NPDC058860]|uniref:hypothetical protein n=1 Tax=Inquilinus sp. NPDC058860 TaxID=3346652 RepID=UPI003684339B
MTGLGLYDPTLRLPAAPPALPPLRLAGDPIEPPRPAALDPAHVGRLVRAALKAVAAGTAYGEKVVLQPGEPELLELLQSSALDSRFTQERLNWKLSALVSVNDRYGGVKIVGSNAYNRLLNLPRSRSTILLFDKLTMQPLAVYDGTEISAARTGAYASIAVDLFLAGLPSFAVFLFGAGAVAEKLVADLQAHHGPRIAAVYVKSRTPERAAAFAAEQSARTAFPVIAVADEGRLPACRLVVTASNAREPVFDAASIGPEAVVLHLGGDETPPALIRSMLESGTVMCDDVHSVSHRNSQSLALYFSRSGRSLEAEAGRYQILSAWQAMAGQGAAWRRPALLTCVGLPVLDLYVAQSIHETLTGGPRTVMGAEAA